MSLEEAEDSVDTLNNKLQSRQVYRLTIISDASNIPNMDGTGAETIRADGAVIGIASVGGDYEAKKGIIATL